MNIQSEVSLLKIYEVAKGVREKVIAYQRDVFEQLANELPSLAGDYKVDLCGYCAIASRVLCYELLEAGFDSPQMKFIHSGETGYTHCWAEIPETQLMVDITADQFSASYDSVVIKNKDEHYNIHKLTGTLVCVNPFEELEVFQSFKHWAKDQIPTQRTVQDVLSFTLN